jgi:nijmegen breakage syndrome protein 1
MFDGYTFVFYEKRQYETLFAPISEGHGKVLFREVIPDETTVDDFVRYVKGVAGEKGLGEFEDGSEGKGVVIVRFNPVKGPGSEWFAGFSRQVALHLDHRLIEQNEFLDAILGNDASVLRRPLLLESSGIVAPPPTASKCALTQYSILG